MTGRDNLIPVGKPLGRMSCEMLRAMLDGPVTSLDLKAAVPWASPNTIKSHPAQLIRVGLALNAGRDGRYVRYAITNRGRQVLLAMGGYERAIVILKRAWQQ